MTSTAILIGHEPLAAECGQQWLSAGHGLAAVVTRHHTVRHWARDAGLTVVDEANTLIEKDIRADWLFSIANLDMLPGAILDLAAEGAVNFHDGPLPRYAGLNAPVWAIANGERDHAVTWHLMDARADHGDILVQRDVAIAPDDTAFTLNAKCFAAGVDSFAEVIAQIDSGLPDRRAQDLSDRSYFGRTRKPEAAARIDTTQTAGETLRLIRALDHGGYDNPVASPWIATTSGPVLVRHAALAEATGQQGTILAVDEDGLTLAFRDAALRLTGLTDPMGATVMPGDIFAPGDVPGKLQDAEAHRQSLEKIAENEARWRDRVKDFRPADWPMTPGEGSETRIALSTDAPSERIAAAFAALVTKMSGGPVDLALASGDASPVASPWRPVRFDPDGGWQRATEAFAKATEAARAEGPFAFDLPARIADLSSRKVPAAAIGEVPGAALTLAITDAGATLIGNPSRIGRDDTTRIAARLDHLLSASATLAPETPVAALPTLPEAERDTVLNTFNATDTAPPDQPLIHRAFEAQADRTPDATALVFQATSLTYADLNARANRLAHVLIGAGVTPGDPVGLHLGRTEHLVIAALAILKAGGAYVPLDPAYPADRLSFYASDSGARIILSETTLSGDLVPEGTDRLLIDTDPRLADAPDTNPDIAVSGSDPAYLIYTSGSTGTPKGVMVEHRNVTNFFTGMDARIDYAEGDTWLAVTSLSFDISVLELFWTLARGFKLILMGDEKLVADGAGASVPGGMDFSLFYWGNDDGVGRDKYGLLLDGARFADENGFQAVWTPERHFHAFGGLYPNPSVTGAAVAAVTRNIAVRAGSVVAPLHHPARIAEEWAVIDNLTNGRTGLAIASGWHPDDFVLRPENAPPDNKPAVFDAIRDLRTLWSGQPLAMPRADGEVIEKLTQPRPVSKELEMWLTIAGNPDAWRQAGEAGVHVLTHLLGQTIEEVEEKIAIYHDALRASGRDPDAYKVTLMLHTYLAETRETAMEIAREPMKAYLRAAADLIKQYAWAFPAFKRPKGVETPRKLDLAGLSEDEMDDILEFAFQRYFETSGLFGTVDDALARVAQIKSIGVTEVACLIDYGIERQTILDSLHPLAKVRAQANAGSADTDFSIAAQIARHGVTHLQSTPYMARMLLESDASRAALKRLRHLLIGGEAFPANLAADLRAATNATIHNMYGPTETTIWSTTGPVAGPSVSVGTPVANTRCYVLDDAGQLLGIGETGELCIGGAGVTRGYWNRPDLTDEKFPENPFHEGRMFRTGDLARWRGDGTLDILGRRDAQVKLRGYRIEIGEIEAAMETVPGVTGAVAVIRKDASGTGQILGYVTGTAFETDIRAALARTLPDFMLPSRILRLDAMPLTPNRKIDRKALPEPGAEAKPAPKPIPASTPGAASDISIDRIAAIWSAALGVTDIQPSDNFFDLGGHSLLAIEVHRRLKADLGLDGLSIADIFRAPTLAGLHSVIQRLGTPAGKVAPPPPARKPAPKPAAPGRPVIADDSLIARRRALRAARVSRP